MTSKLNHIYRGSVLSHIKEREREPQMLGIQEERNHMSLRGERHVSLCYDFCALICFALIFFSLYSPIIQYKIQGEKDI